MDLVDNNRTRTPKKSALVYKEIIRSRVIDYDYNPDPYNNALCNKIIEKSACNGAITHNSQILLVLLIVLFNFLH